MRCFFYVILLIQSQFLYSQDNSLLLKKDSDGEAIGNFLRLFEDKDGGLTIKDILDSKYDSQFTVNRSLNLNFGTSRSYFWVKLTIDNEFEEAFLRIGQPIIKYADMYFQQNDGWACIKSGYAVELSKRVIKSANPVFPLLRGKHIYYLRVKANLLAVPISVVSGDKLSAINFWDNIIIGFACGVLLITATYYIFFGMAFRSIEFPLYVVLVIFYALGALSQQGYLLYFYNDRYFEWQNFISCIVIAWLLIYSYVFLKLNYSYWVIKYLYWLFVTLFGAQAIYSTITKDAGDLFLLWQVGFFFVLPLNIISGFYVVKRNKDTVFYFFSLAYILFFGLLCLELLHLANGFPYYLQMPYVLLGYLIEVCTLGYALSRKFQNQHMALRISKEEAAAENLRIINNQKNVLEEMVALRTKELIEKSVELEKRNFKISSINEELKIQKDEIENKNMQLEVQNSRLTTLNDEKNSLLGLVSHDLRTPIGHIIGFSNILKFEFSDADKRQTNILNKIIDSGNRLNSMLGNILNVEAIESGKFRLNIREVNVAKLLGTLKEEFLKRASEKQIEIIIEDKTDSKLTVLADETYLHQALENLVSNAIKFAPQKTFVFLGAQRKDDKIILTVRDQGPGFSESDRSKMFGKFQRLSAQPIGNEKSTGLGLSIVKKLVELMNGTVSCNSNEGNGAEFIVQLPAFQNQVIFGSQNIAVPLVSQLVR